MPASLEDQLADIFADFRDFAGLPEIATKKGGRVPFNWGRWHAEQKQFEEERTGRDIVLKPRQIGFSTLELARDLRFAVTNEGVNVLVVGHDKKLAEDLFANLKVMADALEELVGDPGSAGDDAPDADADDPPRNRE